MSYYKKNDKDKGITRPIEILDRKKFEEGSIYQSRAAGLMQVIDYNGKFDVTVRFLDTGYTTKANMDNIRAGSVKDPYHRTVYGGYFGEGPYIAYHDMKVYKVWEGILRRTCGKDVGHIESYKNVSICEEWRNLQVFAAWYYDYRKDLNPLYYNELQIDKDILQWRQEYKLYSPQTCCMIPGKLNTMLSGSNKLIYDSGTNLENQQMKVRELADFYIKENAIKKDIYDKIYTLDFSYTIINKGGN